MRQELGSHEVLSLAISREQEIDYKMALENGRNDLKLKLEKYNFVNIHSTLSMYTLPGIETIAYAYTRGDNLAEIEKRYMSPSVSRMMQTCADIDALDLVGRECFWGAAAGSVGEPYEFYMNPTDVLGVISLISYCVHFGVNNDDIKKLIPYLAPAGKSKIVDAVLSTFDDSRIVDESGAYQQTFVGDALYEIYQAPMDEKPVKIKSYLKNWLKLLSKQLDSTAMQTLGHYMRYKHKTPKTLYKDAEGDNPLYKGHWAWEIACLVKLQGIDDSSFRDHEWYPKDMVDYAANK